MTSGKLRSRLHFQRRAIVDDGYGNETSGDFETRFTDAAELIPLKGTEPVVAARLTGVQPYVVRVRSHEKTREVNVSWRAVDARDETRIFNITAAADMDQKNHTIDLMATQGVVT